MSSAVVFAVEACGGGKHPRVNETKARRGSGENHYLTHRLIGITIIRIYTYGLRLRLALGTWSVVLIRARIARAPREVSPHEVEIPVDVHPDPAR